MKAVKRQRRKLRSGTRPRFEAKLALTASVARPLCSTSLHRPPAARSPRRRSPASGVTKEVAENLQVKEVVVGDGERRRRRDEVPAHVFSGGVKVESNQTSQNDAISELAHAREAHQGNGSARSKLELIESFNPEWADFIRDADRVSALAGLSGSSLARG